jgi:Glycosyl hydrolase family 92 catalytic domain
MPAVVKDLVQHAVDAGAMQSWALWNLLGLFPVTSQVRDWTAVQFFTKRLQPIYLISSPHFSAIDVRLKTVMVGPHARKEPAYLSIRADGLSNSSYCTFCFTWGSSDRILMM